MLESCVGGGIPTDCGKEPSGSSPYFLEAMKEEALEEANYGPSIMERAVLGSVLMHRRLWKSRSNPDRAYNFDLELSPSEFYTSARPQNNDGEVGDFIDMSPEQIITSLETGYFTSASGQQVVGRFAASLGAHIASFVLSSNTLI